MLPFPWLLIVASLAGVTTAQNSSVFRFSSTLTEEQVKQLEPLQDTLGVDFLTHAKAGSAFDVIVPKVQKEKFQIEVKKIVGQEAEDITSDVMKQLKEHEEENDKQREATSKFRAAAAPPTTYYATLREIYAWIDSLPANYKNIQLENIGSTHEGQPMIVVKLNSGLGRPIVFVESGIHAREWLGPATSMYMLDKIIKGANAAVTDKYEFHFLLVSNPDGYEFTHMYKNYIEGRFWRKNRRPSNVGCEGADLNRNFDIFFGRVGVARSCSAETYPGSQPFSEPESQNMANYILKIASKVKLYLSIHTFGQMIIVPYTYKNQPPPDDARLRSIANEAVKAFASVGKKRYSVGTAEQLGLGLVSGSSVDWVKDVAKIATAFAFELMPVGVDALNGGFNPPSSVIIPSGEETLAAFLAMLKVV